MIVTGNLNNEVKTNPPFPGKERHFLRALLARIFHATAIAPKGLYEMTEAEEGGTAEIKLADEFTMPGADELKSLETWGNALPLIMVGGATTFTEPEDLDEAALEELKAKMETEDPPVEAFRSLAEMKGMPGTALNAED